MKQQKKSILYLATGIFLLILAGSLRWLISPQFLKLSDDFEFTADLVSTDNLYNEERKEYEGSVYSKTEYAYRTVSNEGKNLIIKNSFSVRTPEDEALFSVERLYGINPQTGAHVQGLGDKDRSGYLFAPSHLEEGEDFIYWHINYDGPAKMNYVGKEKLNDLLVFRYETHYEEVTIDQTVNLTHLPEVGVTRGVELEPHLELWIEPKTGQLVKYEDQTTAYFYDLNTKQRLHPWNQFSNTFDEKSVENIVSQLRLKKVKYQITSVYLPIILLLVGLWSLIVFIKWDDAIKSFFTLKRLNLFIALGLITCSILTLLMWASPGLSESFESTLQVAKMNPLTAISFLILGLGLWLRIKKQKAVSIYFGSALVAISFLRLLNIYDLIDFAPDLFFFSDLILSSQVPARMGMFTAIGFFLMGLALLSDGWAILKKFHLVEILTSVSVLFSILIVGAYGFELNEFLQLSIFYSVSFSTALLFLFSGLALFSLPHQDSQLPIKLSGWLTVTIILISAVLATVVVTGVVERNILNNAQTAFEVEVDRAVDDLEERLNIYINTLSAGSGFINGSETVRREEWKAYVDSLGVQENYPGIQGIGYTIFVPPDEKEAHIQAIQEEGFADYTIKPEGDRDIYSAIIYLEPFDERNQQAFGYDMFSNDIRRLAMEQARDTGQPKISGRITLVQEIDEDVQPGFLIYVPVYAGGTHPKTLEKRQESIVGYVYSPFRARNFVEGAIGEGGLKNIGLVIYDGTKPVPEHELYNDLEKIDHVQDEASYFSSIKTLYVAGRPWTLNFQAVPGYGVTALDRATPILILLVGVGISLMITFVIYTLASSRQKAIAYGEKLTKNLRSEKAKDEAILNNIGEGLVVVDELGRITLVNKTFSHLTGWKPQEIYGKTLLETLPMFDKRGRRIPDSRRLISQTLKKQTKATKSSNSVFYYERKDGNRFPIDLTISPILIDKTFVGAVEVFKDITKEREVDRAKTEFVSLASHQLRTPLTSIKLFVELLALEGEGRFTKKQKEYFKNIDLSVARMIQLVNDLLNVSRLESGKMTINPELIDLKVLIKTVTKEFKGIAQNKDLRLSTKLPKSKWPKILIDPSMLHEVIVCFLSNAIRYTKANEGEIQVSLKKTKSHYLIEVEDNGIGIPKELQANIFKKFFRAANAVQKEADGSGLGLYIAHMIMKASGGTVGFKSSEKGSTFYAQIPLKGMKARKGEKRIAKL